MRIWRLATAASAKRLDGGFGINHDGRWNSKGRRVTYGATVPSLTVLEKLVHLDIQDAAPTDLIMLAIEAPDDGGIERVGLDELPEKWEQNEALTRSLGDRWHAGRESLLLIVPSVVVAYGGALDRNVVINHEHRAAQTLRIVEEAAFRWDERLAAIFPVTGST